MKLYIKYMVSLRCRLIVKEELEKLGIMYVAIDLGVVEILEDISAENLHQLKKNLLRSGLELMDDKKSMLIEQIRNLIIERIRYSDQGVDHGSNQISKVNYSDFLSEKLGYDYAHLSSIFSEVKGITIQQFIILHKIERVKELLLYNEISLTEIAYQLQYSSVAHLSNQFKKITGLSPSFFKMLGQKRKKSLEKL